MAACGPWIITKDEIPDPHNVVVKSWTSGEPRQNYNTKYMAHKIPEQIAWLTKVSPPQSWRHRRHRHFHEGLRPMNPGDSVEIEFENMGRAKFEVKGTVREKTRTGCRDATSR